MSNIEWRVIVNSRSGGGKALSDWPIISDLLKAAGIIFSEVFTEGQYHAIELAANAIKDGYRKILVLGGDGALHEVINGIFSQKEVSPLDITIALIPIGSGNDWARMHKIPKNYKAAVKVLAEYKDHIMVQDVVRVKTMMDGRQYSRYMMNIGGLGFDSDVCRRFEGMRARGKASVRGYYKCVLQGFLFTRCINMRVKIDDKPFFSGPAFSVSIGNGKYSGGGMLQTPDAVPNDGLINITIFRKTWKPAVMKRLPDLYRGNIYNNDFVLHAKGKKMEIEASPFTFIELDGELSGRTPVIIEVIPSAINVVSCM